MLYSPLEQFTVGTLVYLPGTSWPLLINSSLFLFIALFVLFSSYSSSVSAWIQRPAPKAMVRLSRAKSLLPSRTGWLRRSFFTRTSTQMPWQAMGSVAIKGLGLLKTVVKSPVFPLFVPVAGFGLQSYVTRKQYRNTVLQEHINEVNAETARLNHNTAKLNHEAALARSQAAKAEQLSAEARLKTEQLAQQSANTTSPSVEVSVPDPVTASSVTPSAGVDTKSLYSALETPAPSTDSVLNQALQLFNELPLFAQSLIKALVLVLIFLSVQRFFVGHALLQHVRLAWARYSTALLACCLCLLGGPGVFSVDLCLCASGAFVALILHVPFANWWAAKPGKSPSPEPRLSFRDQVSLSTWAAVYVLNVGALWWDFSSQLAQYLTAFLL